MTEKEKGAIHAYCMTAKLLGMSHEEVEKKLVNTEIVRMANWGDVCEIIDGYFRVKKGRAMQNDWKGNRKARA